MSCLGTSVLLIPGDVNCEVNLFKQNRASGQILIFHTAKVLISYLQVRFKTWRREMERKREGERYLWKEYTSARTIAAKTDKEWRERNVHAYGRNGRKHEREREREKRGGQKKGEAKLLGKLEKRELHRSAELFVVYLDILRYFFMHSTINRARSSHNNTKFMFL